MCRLCSPDVRWLCVSDTCVFRGCSNNIINNNNIINGNCNTVVNNKCASLDTVLCLRLCPCAASVLLRTADMRAGGFAATWATPAPR